MQYCTALPSDRRNKATRRERLVSLGAAGTMSYLHLGKIDPNGMFWQFGVGMRVSPEVTEYHTSWYIAQYDAWQMTPWFIPAPRGEADEVPETFGHQRNCALIKYGSSMQKSLWNFKKSPSFPKKNIGFQKSSKPFCELHLTQKGYEMLRVCQGFPFKKPDCKV